MRIFAVGDIHQARNIEAIEEAIDDLKPDLSVFLGDYFDGRDSIAAEVGRTAEWLKAGLHMPRRVHLWGNHDLPYAFPCVAPCTGFRGDNAATVRWILNSQEWSTLSLWHATNGWLFSHAGLSQHHAPSLLEATAPLCSWLECGSKVAWTKLTRKEPHWILARGRSRGGDTNAGGLLWCDFDEEFVPIPGLNQVFGHTPAAFGHSPHVRLRVGDSSCNWCIDTSSTEGVHVALLLHGSDTSVITI
ncbi:hypothetical protein DB347_17615 [Opitutaceae bacterium EW11]|nr:hypothetical protein DB347_17615 [Opitutaceae bacterium EW11]